jgi:hypothetical protein
MGDRPAAGCICSRQIDRAGCLLLTIVASPGKGWLERRAVSAITSDLGANLHDPSSRQLDPPEKAKIFMWPENVPLLGLRLDDPTLTHAPKSIVSAH